MGVHPQFRLATAMATRWRRRRLCVLLTPTPAPAALRDISGSTAFLETNARPALGDKVELRHPEAGSIHCVVRALASDGVAVDFDYGERSVAFALAAITADMSDPA